MRHEGAPQEARPQTRGPAVVRTSPRLWARRFCPRGRLATARGIARGPCWGERSSEAGKATRGKRLTACDDAHQAKSAAGECADSTRDQHWQHGAQRRDTQRRVDMCSRKRLDCFEPGSTLVSSVTTEQRKAVRWVSSCRQSAGQGRCDRARKLQNRCVPCIVSRWSFSPKRLP
jgi:hypothetical protein